MPRLRVVLSRIAAWTAHVLAWAVGAVLVFVPTYEGVSVQPALPGEPAGELVRTSATLLEVNGPRVLLLLAFPVFATAAAVWGVQFAAAQELRRRKLLLWVPAITLLAFCVVGALSVGLLYFPAALALLIAAAAAPPNTPPKPG